jgi:response regulator RpfG family c-di-GMP phosphodiesterase
MSEGMSADAAAARILVVDDEAVITLSFKETLSREGYQVAAENDPLEALQRLKDQAYALLLVDQRMPRLSGLEFLSQAKLIQPDATRILMTGVLNLDTVINAINQGEIYRFIVKPWLREELLVTVKNGVQRYELIRRNAELQRATMAMNEKLAQLNKSLEQQVGRQAEQSHKHAELNLALQKDLHRSVELCLKTMEIFHPNLGEQARRVGDLCRIIAEDLKLSPEQRQVFEYSAWLHDIGLMSVPRRLIRLWQRNPSSLNSAELKLIQQHPILGQELIGVMHHLVDVGAVIRAHHERFDGQGFPDQLAGEEIPWLARLLAVVTSFVETSVDEPTALEQIKQRSGTLYDPEAVRAFLRNQSYMARSPKEREVLLAELKAGMVVARGIYTAEGLLLIPDGQTLNDSVLDKLRNHNRVSPIRQSLVVYC